MLSNSKAAGYYDVTISPHLAFLPIVSIHEISDHFSVIGVPRVACYRRAHDPWHGASLLACFRWSFHACHAQVKSLGKPPYGVKLTMEATCIMFGIKPDKINDPDNPGKKAR